MVFQHSSEETTTLDTCFVYNDMIIKSNNPYCAVILHPYQNIRKRVLGFICFPPERSLPKNSWVRPCLNARFSVTHLPALPECPATPRVSRVWVGAMHSEDALIYSGEPFLRMHRPDAGHRRAPPPACPLSFPSLRPLASFAVRPGGHQPIARGRGVLTHPTPGARRLPGQGPSFFGKTPVDAGRPDCLSPV